MSKEAVASLPPQKKIAILNELLKKQQTVGVRRAIVSRAQHRLWFLDQLEPEKSTYNISVGFRMRGPLRVDILQAGLNRIIQRHESLRCRFFRMEDDLVQEILPTLIVPMSQQDLRLLPVLTREAEARRLAEQDALHPFNLSTGPLIRFKLMQLEEDENILVITMHHIISDGWSLSLFIQELSEFYRSSVQGRKPVLPALPIQYSDYSAWQNEEEQRRQAQEQLLYWETSLEKYTPILDLPTDFPRSHAPTRRGTFQREVLSPERMEEIRQACRQHQITPFMFFLAGFQTLLFHYTRQNDFLIGCPVSGRTRVETENLIGFFINTLPLRSQIDGAEPFSSLLARARETSVGAFAHQDVPFEQIVERLQPERALSHAPLFQVAFAYQNTPDCAWNIPGLSIEQFPIEAVGAKFDLTLFIYESSREMVFEFSTDLFHPETIRNMMKHLELILHQAALNPSCEIQSLFVLTDEENKFLSEINQTATDYPADRSVTQVFEHQATLTPDKIAVEDESSRMTYAQLNAKANRLAHHLERMKVKPGDRVGICLNRSIEMIVAMLASLKAGAVYVPLEANLPPDRLSFLAKDLSIAVIISESRLRQRLPRLNCGFFLFDENQPALEVQSDQNLPACVDPNAPAYVLYTSGSTGKPKGVTVPHRAINRLVLQTNYVQLNPQDAIAQVSNCSFDAATFEIWGALLNGARLVLFSQEILLSTPDFAVQLREKKITALFLTTALFNQMACSHPDAFRHLRYLLFGGEAADPRWVREIIEHGKPQHLYNVYGPTETTTFATYFEINHLPENCSSIPIGKPISNTTVFILDEKMQPLPLGAPGELYIGGDGVALGYFNRPELTQEKFVPDPQSPREKLLYRSGDIARFRPDGNIEFLGRKDHQVKIRGFRIELHEIEFVLGQHPGIQDVLVLARQDTPGEKRLAAYFIPRSESGPSSEELRSFLQNQLPHYMIPSCFVPLERFPLNINGKVDRAALPMPGLDAHEKHSAYIPPGSPLEYQLVDIWENILNLRPIGIRDNFFELGGHSLLAAKMVDRIERICGKKVPLSSLFAGATIEHLVGVMLQDKGNVSHLIEIQKGDSSQIPLFFLHGDFHGGGFYCSCLARSIGADQPFYALEPHGLDGGDIPDTIEAMAAEHLQVLLKFRPQGPYLLGGHCNGGLVAFEMARQLEALGQKVDLVMMIDARGSNCRLLHESIRWIGRALGWNASKRLNYFLKLRDKWFRLQKWMRLDRKARQAMFEKKIKELFEFLWHGHTNRAAVGLSTEDRKEFVSAAYAKVVGRYFPKWYSGRIILLRSGSPSRKRWDDPALGWNKISPSVQVLSIPGDHLTCVSHYSPELGRVMKKCLDQNASRNDRSSGDVFPSELKVSPIEMAWQG